MKKLIDKAKQLYKKPFIKNAVDTMAIAWMEQFLKPRGFQIVAISNVQTDGDE